jgi:hypothetical protein
MTPIATIILVSVLLLGGIGRSLAASEEFTGKFNPDIYPRFDPKTDQSSEQGGTQKYHRRTEFEMAVDRCVEKVREELSDTNLMHMRMARAGGMAQTEKFCSFGIA